MKKLFYLHHTQMSGNPHPRHRSKGFSLVEVALSVGIVGFGMTVILGCLPVGLMSVKDSKIQSATANISRQLRGELQQISFESTNPEQMIIADLSSQPAYYSQEGMPVKTAAEAYFVANFVVNSAEVSGTEEKSTFAPANAREVTVELAYPYEAPEANRETAKISLLLARQRGS